MNNKDKFKLDIAKNYGEITARLLSDAEYAIDNSNGWYIFNNSDQFDYEVDEEENVLSYYVPYYIDMHFLHKMICEMLMAKYGSEYNNKYVIVYDYVAPEDGMPSYERIYAFTNPSYNKESC